MPQEFRDRKTGTLLFKATPEDNHMLKTMKENVDLKKQMEQMEEKIDLIEKKLNSIEGEGT